MCVCDIIYKKIGFTQKDVSALCVAAPLSTGGGERNSIKLSISTGKRNELDRIGR